MNAKEKQFIQIQSKIENLKKLEKNSKIEKNIFELTQKLNVLKLEIKPIDKQIKEIQKKDKKTKLYNDTVINTFDLFFEHFVNFSEITGNENEFYQFELIDNIIIEKRINFYMIIYSKSFINLGGSFINLQVFNDNYFNIFTEKNLIFKYSNLKSMIHVKVPLSISWSNFLIIRKKTLNLQTDLKF